ncbi:hypothetical protein MMC12_003030 [Toensbergia leucococca]|nr:hypothetical protein [Toensbergia leucococca]
MSSTTPTGLQSNGTVDGENVDFTYELEDQQGTLILRHKDWEDRVSDKQVIALIDSGYAKKDGDDADQLYFLLLVNTIAQSDFGFRHIRLTKIPKSFLDAHYTTSHPQHLFVPQEPDCRPNLHVVISVRSGTGLAQPFFNHVVKKTFSILGLEEQAYSLHTTTSEQTIIDFTHTTLLPRANQGIAQTVLLLSGDGGVVDIINVLLSSSHTTSYVKPVVGLIAMGTGNALANSTGLNNDSTRGLASFLRGTPKSLPTFAAKFPRGSEHLVDGGLRTEALASLGAEPSVVYGAVVCSWALHASLVADSDTPEYRKYGTTRFQMAAKELLEPSDGLESHRYKGKITLIKTNKHGEETHQTLNRKEHIYVLATLVSNLEETFTVSPSSKPLDGQLRFLNFGAAPSAEIMRILGLAFQGGLHVQEDAVGYDEINGLRIDFEESDSRWLRVCVDGKIIRVGEEGWVEVRKTFRDVVHIVAN